METITQLLNQFTPAVLFVLPFAAAAIAFFVYYWYAIAPRKGTLEWIAIRENNPQRLVFPKRYPMMKGDILPLLIITVIYAATAFFRLGNLEHISSSIDMKSGQTIRFELAEETEISEIRYYSGIGYGYYNLMYATDSSAWETAKLEQPYDRLLRWNKALAEKESEDEADKLLTLTGKYFQLRATLYVFDDHPSKKFLEIGELALFDAEGNLVEIASVSEGGEALFDEQELVREYYYSNSSYFDEIYHPRTAIEHVRNVYPYEVSHPPLGKLTMALGILMFGENPFGWRFVGTLFGVLMLPILYVFLKNMFGRIAVAACGTTLFAAEFMHLTQTRLATIDTYGVFYILAMYFFMYRWLTIPPETKFWKTLPSLFLCGLMFGIGIASKWIVVYGGVGLAVLWLIGLIVKYKGRRALGQEEKKSFVPFVLGTILVCILFFVAIPAAIYIASYIPYVTPDSEFTIEALLKETWDNQVFMLTYHQGASDYHPYSSRWYQWIFDIRPILYFRETDNYPGWKSTFAAFNNPLISWAGLGCVIITAIEGIRRKCGRALFLFIAYISQLLPWMFITRTVFAYHYFPSILFCVMAISYTMDVMLTRRKEGAGLAVYGLTAAAVALYAAFYPVLVGIYVPTWYTTNFLRWFPSWPL